MFVSSIFSFLGRDGCLRRECSVVEGNSGEDLRQGNTQNTLEQKGGQRDYSRGSEEGSEKKWGHTDNGHPESRAPCR